MDADTREDLLEQLKSYVSESNELWGAFEPRGKDYFFFVEKGEPPDKANRNNYGLLTIS